MEKLLFTAEQRRNFSLSTPMSSRNVNRDSPAAASPGQMNQILPLPWDTIVPTDFQDSATNPVELELECNRNVAKYILNVLNDTRFKTVGRIAEIVVKKFPEAYEKKVWIYEKSALSNEAKDLTLHIYDLIRYVNRAGLRDFGTPYRN